MVRDGKRKLAVRLVGAPLLLAGLLSLVWLDHRGGQVVAIRFLVAAICGLGMVEFLFLVQKKGLPVAWSPAIPLLVLPALPWSWMLGRPVPELFIPAAALFIASLLYRLLHRFGSFPVEAAGCMLLGFFYVGSLQLVCAAPASVEVALFPWFLLFLIVTNKGSDMAAFVTGKLVGKRKLAPTISPGKTWEGAIGGAIVGTAGGVVVLLMPLRGSLSTVPEWALLGFAFLVTISAQVGDLLESTFKRWAGAKDSGRLVPEFGGVLDMVDSFLVSVPVAYVGLEAFSRMFR